MFRTANRGFVKLLSLGLLAVCPLELRAQGPPINTDTAFVNGLEGAAFRSFVFAVQRSGLVRDGEQLSDPLDRDVSIYAVPMVVPYEVVKNKLVLAASGCRVLP